MIALIPCRSGSKRVPRKNFLELAGKPLWRWTFLAARDSGCFDQIVVCTDSPDELFVSGSDSLAGMTVLIQKPPLHRDDCRDIEWVTDALKRLIHSNHKDHSVCAPCSLGSYCIPEFSILRVTSPFRGPETIRRAKEQWDACKDRIDSLRAMRRTTETGWKQWVVEDHILVCDECGVSVNRTEPDLQLLSCCNRGMALAHPTMRPLTTAAAKKHLHSFPTQALEDTYIQCGALEMAWTRTVLDQGTIAGQQVGMFLMEGPEALDINTPEDFEKAQELARNCHHQGLESLVDADTPRSSKTP